MTKTPTDAMDTLTIAERQAIGTRKAGRQHGGGVGFFGWAPDLDSPTQRLSFHVRGCEQACDYMLNVWCETDAEAEGLVAALNNVERPRD